MYFQKHETFVQHISNFSFILPTLAAQTSQHFIKKLKITVLSTMLAESGIGEWGFSALVEADSISILFDAGARQRTVIENAKELNADLSKVPTLILSHNHADHTVGWMPLRNEVLRLNNTALSITHVASQIFDTRIAANGTDNNRLQKDSSSYVSSGGRIIVHSKFEEIFPGVYLTGQVPRIHAEQNYPVNAKKRERTGGVVQDNVPEDMSLVIRTEKGLVLLSGCGHAGIINTISHVRNYLAQPLYAAIGGFHLLSNTDEQIQWTADQLKSSGLRFFMGAHCTGIEPVYQIRARAGLKRGECIVGSVGAIFDIDNGFEVGSLTK